MNAPIAVFAYNRPDHLRRMLKSLSACRGFQESRVVVFVDGPRNDADAASVERVRELVLSLPYPNIESQISIKNKGLRRSVHAGVTQLCNEHGRVIVFEDDFVLSPNVLDYFNRGLSLYSEEQRIWSISAYIHDAPELRGRREILILPMAHPWGWATWKRAWDFFPLDMPILRADLESSTFRQRFDIEGFHSFAYMLELSCKGLIDSWFIRWYYTIFKHGASSIFPPRRLVENYGLSGGGTHASRFNPYDLLLPRPPIMQEAVEFCAADRGDDFWALDVMGRSREMRVNRFIASVGGLRRQMRGRA